MSIALDLFCLTVVVAMPSAVELSILFGVGGWGKPIYWSVTQKGTAVCPLWNSPLTSASAADNTTCFSIIHSLWIGPFDGGRRFGAFYGLVVSEFR